MSIKSVSKDKESNTKNIQAYAGEFTISPIPLEMSMNYCTHACAYCFANLNRPDAKLNVEGSINQIQNSRKSKGLTSFLLENGYPVLLSNRVDPFAHSNWRQTLAFIDFFHANGNKIAFQTKGGQGIDEALEAIDYPSNWYISISMLDDLVRQAIEPGAPNIESRFKLIEKLISKGHHVSVGINPLVEDWLPSGDFEQLVKILLRLGVKDYWLETLHLNPKQIANMSDRERKAIGSEIMDEAKKRNRNDSYFRYSIYYLESLEGVNVFSMNQPLRSNYFDSYKKNYPKRFKTHQDFINLCFEKIPNGGVIRFSDYLKFMREDWFNNKFSEADGYVYRIARNVYKELDNTPIKTLDTVLETYWNNMDISKSIFSNDLFKFAFVKGKQQLFTDKNDNSVIGLFVPNESEISQTMTPNEIQDLPKFII